MSGPERLVTLLPMSDDLFDEMQFYAQAKRRLMREALQSVACPGCGCITPANEPTEQCGICKHAGCRGCIGLDGLCDPCHDIEKERNNQC